jgi:hypothetical protein
MSFACPKMPATVRFLSLDKHIKVLSGVS